MRDPAIQRVLRISGRCLAMLVLSWGAVVAAADNALSRFRDSPSLLPAANEQTPFLMAFDGSLFLNDSDRLLSGVLRVAETSRNLAAGSNAQLLFVTTDPEPLINRLERLDGRKSTASNVLGLAATLPVAADGFYLSVAALTRFTATFRYDPEDGQRLRMAAVTGAVSGVELQSEVLSSGVQKGEIALHYHRVLAALPDTDIGVSLKLQNIMTYQRAFRLTEYDEGRLFDFGRDTDSHVYGNVDIGVTHRWRDLALTTVVNDLVPGNFKGPLGDTYRLRPSARMLADWAFARASLNLDLALTPTRGFALVPKRREYGIAADFPVHAKLDLRAGYRYLVSEIDDSYWIMGFNYQLLQYFHLAGEVAYADERQVGGALRIQIYF